MALTGELSDLSLAELIEFFCNQRKTGKLKVVYSVGPGYFYLHSGSVVHASIGALSGIEAVYCALTLPNASFTFTPAFEAPEHTINQPWTSVVLEGLRRMDEGFQPAEPFPARSQAQVEKSKAEKPILVQPAVVVEDAVVVEEQVKSIPVVSQKSAEQHRSVPQDFTDTGAFFSQTHTPARLGSWRLGAVIAAVALIVGVISVPWGWYARSKAAKLANEEQTVPTQNSQPPPQPSTANEVPDQPVVSDSAVPATTTSEAADLAAKRARELRARAKAQEPSTALPVVQPPPAAVNPSVAKTQPAPPAGSKKAVVQVTYDENGRVTQASGGDATALRIARQKRFPAGKAGSATITIPIN
jgi:hypothetical protein